MQTQATRRPGVNDITRRDWQVKAEIHRQNAERLRAAADDAADLYVENSLRKQAADEMAAMNKFLYLLDK